MMAAISAAGEGKRVLLIEKMDQAGRKLRITGKGRCNLTNTAPLKEFISHIGSDGRFMRNSFSRFFNEELMRWFEEHDVPLTIERGNRVFPASGKSLDIFLALIQTIEANPLIIVKKNTSVKELLLDEEHHMRGVRLQDGTAQLAKKVILCTGGRSYPLTGSTGDGYRMAREVGHTVEVPIPSLVPLVCKERIPADLVGFALKNVTLRVVRPDGKKLCEHFGEMTFTEDGLTGPIVLSTSRIVARPLSNEEPLIAQIDLKPAIDEAQLDKRLIADLDANGTRLMHDAMRMWLPAELIPLALERTKLEKFKRLNQVNAADRKKLLSFLKGQLCTFTLDGTRGFEEAIVTQGGVNLKEVNPKTMESKLVPGLFFAGEILDLDADTGGYNLQIAFSTGVAAGKEI